MGRTTLSKTMVWKAVALGTELGLSMLSYPVHATPASDGDTVKGLYEVLLTTMKNGGSRALDLEISKARQYAALEAAGVRTPGHDRGQRPSTSGYAAELPDGAAPWRNRDGCHFLIAEAAIVQPFSLFSCSISNHSTEPGWGML